jgi:hypothetical protein
LDTILAHLFIAIMSPVAIYYLIKLLKEPYKNKFIIRMLTLMVFLMFNIFAFSVGRIITTIFYIPPNANLWNWWSIFIRIENVTSICWLAYSAYKYKKSGKII